MNHHFKIIVIADICLLCFSGLISLALGQSLGPEFRVNTWTASDQTKPSIAIDGAGNAIIAWHSRFQDGDQIGVFAQRYNTSMVPVGSEFQVNTTISRNQWYPAIEATANGAFVIAWRSNQGLPPDYWDMEYIFFQRYDSTGTAIGSETHLCDFTGPEYVTTPFIALSDSGAFEVFFTFEISMESQYLVGQEVDAGGNPIGDEWKKHVGYISGSSVGSNGSGRYVFAWGGDYLSQAFTGTVGGVKNPEFDFTSPFTDVYPVTAAMNSSGEFVICWVEYDTGTWRLLVQRYDSADNPVGAPLTAAERTSGSILSPKVAMLDNGDFLLVWQIDSNIFACHGHKCGNQLSAEFRVNETPSSSSFPTVEAYSNGAYLIAWDYAYYEEPTGWDYDVHARKCYDSNPDPCAVLPAQLDFGSIMQGDSTDLDFTIYNTGCDSLSGTISESSPHYEIVSGSRSYNLAPGDSLVVTVRFKPTQPGTWFCVIHAGISCGSVVCEGIGIEPPPACLIKPDTLDFGSVDVGGFEMMNFDITNTGYGTLNGTVSDTCPNFDIITGGSYSLTHDQTQTVTVIFYPLMEGLHSCMIETGNGACTDVQGMGYGGEAPLCLVEPDTLDFGTVTVGDSLDMSFDIINAGGGVLLGSVSDTCSYYNVVAGSGAFALASGETLNVTVRFKPETDGSFECWVEAGTADCIDVCCLGAGDDVSGMGIVDGRRFHLYQNYPNPFNPTTSIMFTVPARAHTNLSIYNIEGRLVKTLVDAEIEGSVKTVTWSGTDSRNHPVSSGVYFYRLRAGDDVMTKKMILLK
jgi:hypothetical protein